MVPFRDAGEDPSLFETTVLECLRGLEKAINLGWYNFHTFDYKEYENVHKLENGDMNWIIPKKILALSSPSNQSKDGLHPSAFIDRFHNYNIKGIIRLNETMYNESIFEQDGIKVYN